MKRQTLRLTSAFRIMVRSEGIDQSELRQRQLQVLRSIYRKQFLTRGGAEDALAAAVAKDRVGADWCEVEEIAYL